MIEKNKQATARVRQGFIWLVLAAIGGATKVVGTKDVQKPSERSTDIKVGPVKEECHDWS